MTRQEAFWSKICFWIREEALGTGVEAVAIGGEPLGIWGGSCWDWRGSF